MRRPQSRHRALLELILWITAGVSLLVFGVSTGITNVSEANDRQRLLDSGSSAVGIITDVQLDENHGRYASSFKVFTVEYTIRSGETYSHIDDNEAYRSREEGPLEEVSEKWLGREVAVFYDSSNPAHAVVDGWEGSLSMAYFGGFFLGAMGIGTVALGVWMQKHALREMPQPA